MSPLEREGSAEPEPAPNEPAPNASRLDETLRSMSRGTSVMVVATLLVVVLQFFTRAIVTRNVTTDQWGEFNLGFSLASLLALTAAFGIPTATARSLAFEQTLEARFALVRKAIYVSVPVGAVAGILVYVFAGAIAAPFAKAGQPSLTPVFQLFSVSIALTMLSNVLVGIFQGLERAEPYAIFIQIVNPALFLAFTAALLGLRAGFEGVLIGYVLSWVGSFAGLAVYTYRRLPPLLRRLSTKEFTGDASGRVPFVALSVTLFGVAALSYVTSYADTLLLGVFRAATPVGEYSSAMTLTRLLLVGTGTVTFIYLPITSRLRRQRDFEGLRSTYITVTRWMTLLAVPFTFVFFFDARFSLAFSFGPLQVGGSQALMILVVANTLAIALGPSVSTLGGLGETRLVLWFTVVSALSNVVLCFVLIPPYGLVGAAVAWSVARLVFPALALARIYQEHRITPFGRTFVRPSLLSLAILLPVFVFLLPRPTLIWLPILVLFPLVVFLGSILLLRCVEPGDLHFAMTLERRLGPVARPIRRLLEARLVPGSVVPESLPPRRPRGPPP